MIRFIILQILLISFIFSESSTIDSIINSNDLNESFKFDDDILEDDIFEQLLTESKLIFAEAVLADMNRDTMYALYYFDKLFRSVYQLVQFNADTPDFVKQKYENY